MFVHLVQCRSTYLHTCHDDDNDNDNTSVVVDWLVKFVIGFLSSLLLIARQLAAAATTASRNRRNIETKA
jgi:hypothetical protein